MIDMVSATIEAMQSAGWKMEEPGKITTLSKTDELHPWRRRYAFVLPTGGVIQNENVNDASWN